MYFRSADFNHFLAKCLTKDPQARPTAAELFRVNIKKYLYK